MPNCRLTTFELEARARAHRQRAKESVSYSSETPEAQMRKDQLYTTAQTELAEVYEELVERRVRDGMI